MGCATSKPRRCRNCRSPYSPVPRSYSMHVHHPPQRKGDSYHVVALTSSTMGSLKVELSAANSHPIEANLAGENGDCCEIEEKFGFIENKVVDKEKLTMGIIEAKAWSTMIDQKIPKIIPRTPIRTPPGEPETINAWELMEGLEDAGTISPHHYRSFSFNVSRSENTSDDPPKCSFQEPSAAAKPMWHQIAGAGEKDTNLTSGLSEFDPEIIASFRKSFQELSPAHKNLKSSPPVAKPKEAEKVILYFTSLRGVRKTYEDCCHVRVILKATGVKIDERDVSMHSGFKEELRELMGDGFFSGGLPRVFVGKRYIGGAEEIRRLHEDGQLEKLLDHCRKADDCDGGGAGGVCEGCGDVRFVPCETCSGSCKIYYDIDEDEEDEDFEAEEGEEEFGFQRCPDCNENGLIRCPLCCY